MAESLENVKKLRDITGAGFVDCKKALSENNNDVDKSVDFLRKKGLLKASKKSLRVANEGAIGVFSNNKKSLLIEINTETDFAAKNEIFLNFLDFIGEFALKLDSQDSLEIENFLSQVCENRKISDYLTDIISKIGENIIIKKISCISNDENTHIFSYTHNSYKKNIGKICVILKAEIKDLNNDVKQFGKNMCMHIAASKPLSFDENDLDKKLISKEKEILLETIKSSGKPQNIIDKILDGKIKKYFSEVTFLNQNYILENDKKIDDTIKEFSVDNYFKPIEFKLFVLGN